MPEPQKVALAAVVSAAPAPMLEHLALAVQHAVMSADLPELQADAAHVPDLELS